MRVPEFFKFTNAQVWVVGSHMYGMNTPDSDLDFTGVYHDFLEYRSPFFDRDATVTSNNNDYSLHTAAKFAKMLVKGNFNAIDLVFHEPVVSQPFVKGMLDAVRPYVLTRNLARAYMGYVMSQKDRLVGHKPRSPERTAMVEKIGYDPKYAAHLLRGMYTLYTILQTGEYFYLTPELKAHLTQVKKGEFSKFEVEKEIDSFVPKLERCYNRKSENLHLPELLQSELVAYFILNA